MEEYRHISVNVVDDICVARLLDHRIVDDMNILELGAELFSLVEKEGYCKVLLNFSEVGFLSSAALGKLIMLYKKVMVRNGKLKLSNITPDIHELFKMMNLNSIFDIRNEEADALAAF